MGLLDKIKNLFLEDEEESEEVVLEEENKEVYEEPKNVLPKVMRDTILEETKKQEEVKEEKKFNFPIDVPSETPSRVNNNINRNINTNSNGSFSVNTNKTVNNGISSNGLNVNREVNKKPVELYPKKEEVKFKQKFKPTPVISPVYGVLDKNYKKDEVREKTEDKFEMRRPSKKVDFETVRKKAFGNLSDDIRDNLMCENCELYKEAKRISEISHDDLLYDMLVDENKNEEITIEKAYDNYEDYGVAYEPEKNSSKKIDDLLDTDEDNLEDIRINDKIEDNDDLVEEITKEAIEDKVESVLEDIPTRSEKKKENKVDDDFFQLIDSMYKERVDD